MSLALTRENYFWHKVHSLTGIIPVGFYMVQHLTLNSFSLAGAAAFDGVILFFEGMPLHLLLALEIFVIWLPLLFHAVYGLFIGARGEKNYFSTKYKWSQNLMYSMQRWSGVFLFLFLIYHVSATTIYKYVTGDVERIMYSGWRETLTQWGGVFLIVYAIGVLAASYHLAYGIWNFCIRWGITISDKAQIRIQKFSLVAFIALTLLGWGALAGFLVERAVPTAPAGQPIGQTQAPALPTATVP
jgi:succinate dehydrogenase / fumarate reductase, cytochrome b subunit